MSDRRTWTLTQSLHEANEVLVVLTCITQSSFNPRNRECLKERRRWKRKRRKKEEEGGGLSH